MMLFRSNEQMVRLERLEATIAQLRTALGPMTLATTAYAPEWLVQAHRGLSALEDAVGLLKGA